MGEFNSDDPYARAGRPDDADELVRADMEVCVVEGVNALFTDLIDFCDVSQFNHGFRSAQPYALIIMISMKSLGFSL